MHLYEYLSILRRYWLVVLLPPLIAGAVSLALALSRAPAYQASALALVSRVPLSASAPSPLPDVDERSTWMTTEYILDDLPFVVGSAAFAADVQAALAAEGYPIDAATIRGSLQAEVTHRAVTFRAVAGAPETASALLRATLATLESGGLKYWGRASAGGLHVAVLDPPGPARPVAGRRDVAQDVALRAALALAAGTGLAFLLNAFDDRLRSPRQAEQWLGVRVLGVIPKE
ncbi:MAG: hypothetical protein RMK84_00840 [Oscillochloridaceae bacterium]|nr:hypothetical protein [Chloroflexaceae bacterium]MDW8388643.1 hypothetical protein [Oscillochloridaceae bacterium]